MGKEKIKVNFYNKTRYNIKPLKKKISYIFGKIFKTERNIEMNVIFVNKEEIKKINIKYLKKRKFTDVITFNHKVDIKLKNEYLPFGDIYICPEIAKVNAKKYKISFYCELYLLSIHGALHLKGWRDYSKEERKKMYKEMLFWSKK